ncbi:alpha/beta hydrolase [Calditrichota bacterium]
MRIQTLIKIGIWLLLLTGCEMDAFLFNRMELNDYTLPGNTIPDSLLEEVTFQSDGNMLYGYLVRSQIPTERTILYCHGNKHHIDEYWERVMWLHDLDMNVLVFDYRGFGRSEGSSSETGLHQDGEAAYEFLRSRGLADSVILYGYSLGNVVSIHLAANVFKPLCLIAEAPFASANSLTQGSAVLDIPTGWLTDGDFDNVTNIALINSPFLLMHGTQDQKIRYRDNGRLVFEVAPEPKRLLLIEGGNHDDLPAVIGVDSYLKELRDWINSVSG